MDANHEDGTDEPVEGDPPDSPDDSWIPVAPISDRRLHQLVAAAVGLTALVAGLLLLAHPAVRQALGDAAARVTGGPPAAPPVACGIVRTASPGPPDADAENQLAGPSSPGPAVAVRPDPPSGRPAGPAAPGPPGGLRPVPSGLIDGPNPSDSPPGPAPTPTGTPSPRPTTSPTRRPTPTPRPTGSSPAPAESPDPPAG
jgi:hypothetical protein